MAETTSSITTSQGQASRVINQLAAVVRKIGWSYAILWSLSSKYPGALTWGGGFYNGETKPGINNTRDLGHEALKFYRSKQLEKLYDILVTGESVNQSVTSLSPEDLRDGEWYYLISMSYVFRSGQGLPGRCFAGNEYVWMCNGHAADSKTFHRALLAKSSSIQTVLCIPLKNGALELGTTGLVMEDPGFVNTTIASLSESQPGSGPSPEEIPSHSAAVISNDITTIPTFLGIREHEWRDARMEQESWNPDDLFEFNGLGEDILTDCLISSPLYPSFMTSSFTTWKKPETCIVKTSLVSRPPHNILRKVVTGAWRHKENNTKSNALTEKRRREKMNSMFLTLGSIVPSINKVDKASILAETISHIRELKQRLQELECTDQIFLPNRKETETAMPCGAELTTPSNTDKVRTKMSRKKRKAPEMTGGDDRSPGEVNITVVDKAVQIEVLCPWKEVVITQVFHAITRLNLEVVHFQASKSNALLRMKIKAQPTSSSIVAPGLIGEALLSTIAG